MADSRFYPKKFIREFILLYKSFPALWKVKSKEYNDRHKKNYAYNKMVEKLREVEPEANRDMVTKKINSLRSSHRKERRKVVERAAAGADEAYVPSLWYYDMLQFVIDQDTPRPMISNFEEVSQEPESPSNSDIIFEIPPKASKTKPDTFGDSAQQLIAKASKYLEFMDDDDDDECLTLAKGYATKLRKLTEDQLMFADKIINNALFDAQMGLLTSSSYLVLSAPTSP